MELSKVDQSRDKFQFFSIDPAKGLANIPLQKLGPIEKVKNKVLMCGHFSFCLNHYYSFKLA